MPSVLVTRPVATAALDALRPHVTLRVLEGASAAPSEEEFLREVGETDVIFTMPPHPVTGAVIAAGKRLRLISTLGTGYDNIDVVAARKRGIPVTNAPGILDETTADLAFALLLAAARKLPDAERSLRAGDFRGWRLTDYLGVDVHHQTLGIIGLGRIGQAVARRARGFAMTILYAGPRRKPEAEAALGAEYLPLDELLSRSDFVSLHAPLTLETRHLIDARALARMKPTAVLVNTGRGALVDEGALAQALSTGKLAAAGLDVFEHEPTVHPTLLGLPNLALTPHIGSATAQTRTRMALRAAENILAFLGGKTLLDPVGG